jgi:hypothetical protein
MADREAEDAVTNPLENTVHIKTKQDLKYDKLTYLAFRSGEKAGNLPKQNYTK